MHAARSEHPGQEGPRPERAPRHLAIVVSWPARTCLTTPQKAQQHETDRPPCGGTSPRERNRPRRGTSECLPGRQPEPPHHDARRRVLRVHRTWRDKERHCRGVARSPWPHQRHGGWVRRASERAGLPLELRCAPAVAHQTTDRRILGQPVGTRSTCDQRRRPTSAAVRRWRAPSWGTRR